MAQVRSKHDPPKTFFRDVTGNGQLTLPIESRRLGLTPGSKLVVALIDGRLHLTPLAKRRRSRAKGRAKEARR